MANIIASVPVVAKTLGSKGLAAFWICSGDRCCSLFLVSLSVFSCTSPPSPAFSLLPSSLLPVCSLTPRPCRGGYGCFAAAQDLATSAFLPLSVEALPILQLCIQLAPLSLLQLGLLIAPVCPVFRCPADHFLASFEV